MAQTLDSMINGKKKRMRRIGGQLVEAEEQTQSLAESRGLTAPPTSPIEVAAMGGSPDAAKMAGTAAQKDKALEQAMTAEDQERASRDPASVLSTARRQETARSVANEREQATIQALDTLKDLEGVSDQAKKLIGTRIQDLGQDFDRRVDTADLEAAGFGDEQALALERMRAGDVSGGITEFNRSVPEDQRISSYDQVSQFFESEEEALDRIFSDPELSSSIQVDEQMIAALGGDMAELRDLGIDVSQGMSISDFQTSVNNLIEEEFSRAEELERVSNDPNVSPAMRAEARQELEALGATGVQDVESTIQEIDEAIASADDFEFGGETFTVEELFSDEGISALVKEMIDDPEGPVARQILEDEGLGEFGQYILDNSQAFRSLTEDIDTVGESLGEVQEYNENLNRLGGDVLSDEVMGKIYEDRWGTFQDGRLSKPPFMRAFEDPELAVMSADFVDLLEDSKDDETMFRRLVNLGPNDLRRIQRGGGIDAYKNRLRYRELAREGKTDEVLKELGLSVSPDIILDRRRSARVFGYDIPEESREVGNFAASLKNPRYVRDLLRNATSPLSEEPLPDLRDVGSFDVSPAVPEGFEGEVDDYVNNYVNPLKEYAKDGIIDIREVQQAIDLDSKDSTYIRNLSKIPGIDRRSSDILENVAARREQEERVARLDTVAPEDLEFDNIGAATTLRDIARY